jgi:hypothetical protein
VLSCFQYRSMRYNKNESESVLVMSYHMTVKPCKIIIFMRSLEMSGEK